MHRAQTAMALSTSGSPFSREGGGFIASLQLKPNREFAYTLAVNWKTRLGVGYCFRRADFPSAPILGRKPRSHRRPVEQDNPGASTIKFGTTPLPLVGKKMHGADHCLEPAPMRRLRQRATSGRVYLCFSSLSRRWSLPSKTSGVRYRFPHPLQPGQPAGPHHRSSWMRRVPCPRLGRSFSASTSEKRDAATAQSEHLSLLVQNRHKG